TCDGNDSFGPGALLRHSRWGSDIAASGGHYPVSPSGKPGLAPGSLSPGLALTGAGSVHQHIAGGRLRDQTVRIIAQQKPLRHGLLRRRFDPCHVTLMRGIALLE